MLKSMVKGTLQRAGYAVVRGDPAGEADRLRAELAAAVRDLAAYRDAFGNGDRDRAGYQAAYEQAARELGEARRDRDGYKNAYETVSAALGETKRDLDGYKNAYDQVCTELSDTRVMLRQFKVDPAVVKEATVADPPAGKRLGDAPAVQAAAVAEAARLGLPAKVAEVFADPAFSVEDRAKYMRLSQVAEPPAWDRTAAVVAKVVEGQYRRYTPRSADPAAAAGRADTLRREGIVKFGRVLTPAQVGEVQDYFLKRPIFNGHIPMSARHRVLRRYVGYTAEQFPLGCYSAQEIALAPHLLEVALRADVLDTAAAYFGCTPLLTWLQSWWNFAGPGDYPHRQNFYHRDSNDFGMFWVYIYLTDVGPGSGPHKLLRRSGDFAVVRERFERAQADPALAGRLAGVTLNDLNGLGHGVSDEAKEAIFDGLAEEMTGPAGTMFVTRGIDYHKVVTPLVERRQIYAARFCINEFNYPGPDRDGDPVPSEVVAERVGDDDTLRYVTKLRFDWSNWRG